METQPFGFAQMLAASDWYHRKPLEIVIVGRRDNAATGELLRRIQREYLPNKVITLAEPDDSRRLPIADGKTQVEGKATVYVCHNSTCAPPATSWAGTVSLIRGSSA